MTDRQKRASEMMTPHTKRLIGWIEEYCEEKGLFHSFDGEYLIAHLPEELDEEGLTLVRRVYAASRFDREAFGGMVFHIWYTRIILKNCPYWKRIDR